METPTEQLEAAIKIQTRDGDNADPYQHGFLGGLIYAHAALRDVEPVYPVIATPPA